MKVFPKATLATRSSLRLLSQILILVLSFPSSATVPPSLPPLFPGRFETIKDYFERAHEPGLEHCLCTEVTAMHKKTGRMAVLYASSKESRRRLAGEKNGTSYFEEELRPAFASSAGVMASTASGSSHPGLPPSLSSFCAPSPGIPYLAASGIAVSKVSTPPSTSSLSPLPAGIPSMDEEKEQKYRVDRLYLIFSTERRWDLPKIFEGLEWT